ncbi:glutamine--fructose-6-phosphate transaminase (isomerizing) [Desulforudis sp. DRI-14]|uniref:glutamine--fructose-6-phosphate transaminase (isomerizing) n=1 Tax=Desulforudis sp. DRI-14 TaxID=3459793 RepID=UPI004042C35F
MCGIVGYTGYQTAVPVLLEGLRRLEYRGYDSAGIAVFEENALYLKKKAGELEVLVNTINGQSFNGKSGIGHTRWATHGAPTDLNAHPHIDCTGRFACVHNGIIENYSSLRQWLKAEGHMFRSETDTEVLPHLIEHYYNFDGDLYEAVKRAVSRLHGSFAFLAIALNEPGRLIAVRQDSPLVIGLGEGENFIASDIPAILPYTRKVYLLDDGQMAEVTDSRVNIFDFNGRSIAKDVFHVNWEAEQAEKGGYDHFMIKEICEQPKAVRETLRGRISPDGRRVVFDELSLEADYVRNLNKIFVVACGTAYHAGVVGKYVIEKLVRIPVEADIASEFRYREPIIGGNDLVILVSQSGETADTRAALREAKSRGAHVIAITNVVGSSIAREADDVIYTWAGPEIAVASTKAYVTQLTAFYLLALWLGEARGTLAKGDQQAILWGLGNLPEQIAQTLENTECIAQLARRYADREDVFFIGRGLDYAVAMEGSLKLKEISYIHAEAYAAGELKHGTLALVVPGVPVFALATQPELYDKTVSNIKEVKARGADVIAVALNDHCEIREVADEVICLPQTHPLVAPVLAVVPLQLFAYYAAVARGCEVDKPRNLAKSVTVE